MARILYSCCGEGRGHSSRTLAMARALKAAGHEVRVFASRIAFEVLRQKLPDVAEIPGFYIEYGRNRVQLLPTITGNLKIYRTREAAVKMLEEQIESFRPALCITDFEPFLPLAAKQKKVPFIGVDHQHVIPGLKMDVPARHWMAQLSTLAIVHAMHRGECANLVTSYFQPEVRYHKDWHYFPPILREEIQTLAPRQGEHAVIYQTSTSFSRLPEILRQIPVECRIYAFDKEGTEGNCVFKPRGHPDFLKDVASASWILSNGGYTLISESLHLRKPVFAIPVEGQFEQWINAYFLEKLGFGMRASVRDFSAAHLRQFISRLPEFRANLSVRSFNGNAAVAAKMLELVNGGAHHGG